MFRITIVIVCVLALTLTGCSRYENLKRYDPANISKMKIETNVSEGDVSIIWGKWKLAKLVASEPVSANDNADIEKLIGKKAEYAKDLAIFDDKVLRNPYYKLRTITEADFSSQSALKFKDLGISSNKIVEVDIYSDLDYKKYWPGLGSEGIGGNLLIKDSNSLIVGSHGDYFELIRVE